MIIIAECGKPLVIGIGGEDQVTAVTFDISAWVEAYGAGVPELLHRRAGDSVATPVVVTFANGVVTWTITEADTAYPGVGEAQLIYTPQNRTKKSEIFQTVVNRALTSPAEVPIPMQGWVEQVLEAGAAAEAAETGAQAAQTAAETAQTAAEAAQAAAEEAAASTRDVADQVDQNTGDIADLKAADAAAGARFHGIDVGVMNDTTLADSRWTVGTIRSSDGANLSSTNRIRTGYLDAAVRRVSVKPGYVYLIFAWDGAGTYQGVWNGAGLEKALPASRFAQPTYLAELPAGYSFRVVASKADDGAVTAADGENVLFGLKTDETLTLRGEPADAKAAGDGLRELDGYLLTQQSVEPTAQYTAESDYLAPGGWLRRAYSGTANTYIRIPAYAKRVRITTHGYGVFAFLKDRPDYDTETGQYTPANGPFSDGHGRVSTNAETTFEYPVHPDMRYLYVLLKYTSGGVLTDVRPDIWFDIPAAEFPENSLKARVLNAGIKNLHIPCKAAAATLPIQNGQVGTVTGRRYYYQGDDINGVLYSSVYRDGFDVFWNYNLETYYSALANPASILYTEDYGTRNISNAHAMMGAVCSTYVAWVTGCAVPMNTAQIGAAFPLKNEGSLQEIEVGDVLLQAGKHTGLITQIYTDFRGRIVSADITDEATPINTTRNIRIEDLADYLAENGYRIRRNELTTPRYPAYDGFAADIIYSHGNRTYAELSETAHMWFWIRSAESVFYKKDDAAEYTELPLANVPSDTVNGVTVYDLAAAFDGVGLYTLTTDPANAKQCLIKVIDTGTITVDDANGTITMTGYENCTPAQYQPVGLVANDPQSENNETAGDPPEGYHCNFLYDSQLITGGSPITVVWEYCGSAKGHGGYKVAVDFDTGFGLKRVFSENILPA